MSTDSRARVSGFGVALPGICQAQQDILDVLPDGDPKKPLLKKLIANSGIERRYLAVDPIAEDVRSWGTADRMRRHLDEALPLAKEAVALGLERAGVDASDVGMLCVVSSTGYVTPGIDTGLARDFAMAPGLTRLNIGHMGCFAAIPALQACANYVRCEGRPALQLNVELSSLHLQPPPYDSTQVVVSSLFADAAVATVVVPGAAGGPEAGVGKGGGGLEVVDFVTRTDADHEHCMTWTVTDQGFRMTLSREVPDVLEAHLPGMVDEVLAGHGAPRTDVDWWAVHPGGPGIINAAVSALGLTEEQVAVSRGVLRDYGNCASAGVLMVMDALQKASPLGAGQYGVAMAFGPGLTIHAALVRGV